MTYTITEFKNMLESKDFDIVAGHTDSLFIVGDKNGIEQVIEQACKRFGIIISLDKEWRVLIMFPVQNQYVGVLEDGELYHTDIYGMRNDEPPFFNDIMRGLVTKEILEQFIDPANRPNILQFVRNYVKHSKVLIQTLRIMSSVVIN